MVNQFHLKGRYALLTLGHNIRGAAMAFDVVSFKIFNNRATPLEVEQYMTRTFNLRPQAVYFLTDADLNQLRRNFRDKIFMYCALHGWKRFCVAIFRFKRRLFKQRGTIFK